jgi:hypothetical protein
MHCLSSSCCVLDFSYLVFCLIETVLVVLMQNLLIAANDSLMDVELVC